MAPTPGNHDAVVVTISFTKAELYWLVVRRPIRLLIWLSNLLPLAFWAFVEARTGRGLFLPVYLFDSFYSLLGGPVCSDLRST